MSGAIDAAIAASRAPRPSLGGFWEKPPDPTPAGLTPTQKQAARLMDEAATLVKWRQFPGAAPILMKAASLWPTNPEINYHAGSVLLECGRHEDALRYLDAALALRPRWSDCLNNRSAALSRIGRVEEAVASAEAAVSSAPNYAAMANLCAAYSARGDNDRAIEIGERAVQLSGGTNAMCLINYGVSLRAEWRLEEAAGAQQRAIEVSGGADFMGWSNLGAIRNLQGRNHEALEVTQRAAELCPTNPAIRANMVMFADLLPETTPQEALCRRRVWAYLFEGPLKRLWRAHRNDRDPERRLKVGYVGADFRQHSAAHIHGAVIRAHDPEKVGVYVYAGNRYEDDISKLIREAPALDEWITTAGMTDTVLAERIWADEIDILVDCASFTAGGRLQTFACRPAPIQMTAWGYANGTGLDAMDLFLADEVIVPEGLEWAYSETVVKMSSLLTFDPFLELPPPGPPPVLKNGYITFGSYNRVEKITGPILKVWADVMHKTPDSRIILKFGGLTGETADHLKDAFEHWGIARDRVETRGHTPRDEHIRQYSDIDIMLDSWPHVGGITTLEAAMMGVPCITLTGPRAPSRVSASILTTLGLTDWIADTPERYLEIAAEKTATDLSELRASLPGRLAASVLGNPVRYTRELEQVYRDAFRAWCTQVATLDAPPPVEGAA